MSLFVRMCIIWIHAYLNFRHILGKVICALADGTIAVFRRGPDGQWDLSKYHSVSLGPTNFSVRCLVAVHSKIWCGYRNRIHVLNPKTLKVLVSNPYSMH